MGNKYNGNGELVEKKVLLGLIMTADGKIDVDFDEKAPISELARFYGILMTEVPFLLQHLKSRKMQEDKSPILTPGN